VELCRLRHGSRRRRLVPSGRCHARTRRRL